MKSYKQLKRTGLKRRTPLPPRTQGIRKRSARREAVYAGNGEMIRCPFCDESMGNGRREFVAHVVDDHPVCMIRGHGCTARTQSVHESIRGAERAMVPGPDAERTGQTFYASCFACNRLAASPRAPVRAWLKARGFIQDRVARRVKS